MTWPVSVPARGSRPGTVEPRTVRRTGVPAGGARGWRRRGSDRPGFAVGLVVAIVAGLALLAMPSASAAATRVDTGSDESPQGALDRLVAAGRPGWGAQLDWQTDSTRAYTDRLGAPPVLVAKDVPLPLTPESITYTGQFLDQAAAVGAVPLLELIPGGPLGALDPAVMGTLAAELRQLVGDREVPILLAFAPEMNAPWRPYGQEPLVFRERFRSFAAAVRDIPGVRLVWMPAQGTDYPFLPEDRRAAVTLAGLDTDGDGSLTSADDPYEPYYPGDDVVDWAALTLTWGNPDDMTSPNVAAPPGEFSALVNSADEHPFVTRYVTGPGHPLLVVTGARYLPAAGGASALAVKQSWWEQAIGVPPASPTPGLAAVVWRESGGPDGRLDGRVTDPPALVDALRSDLTAAGTVLGPLYRPLDTAVGSSAAAGGAPELRGTAGWVAVAVVIAAAIGLTALGMSRRSRPWRFPEEQRRDMRIDLLRGIAITFVVVNHIDLPSLYQLLSQEAIGAVSGAELFVLLSGVVVGMVYRPRMEQDGFGETAGKLLRRAWKLYYTALFVIVSVFLLSRIPGVDATAVTTFTDQGTGSAGGGAAGRVYDLYGNTDLLFSYPVPPSVLVELALLRVGPWQFNVIGLYVVLLLVAPLLLWLLRRHLAWAVLALSASLYALNTFHPIRLFPSQFEDAFPLLTWQVLFVGGIVAGYHRRAIVAFFRRPAGRVTLVAAIGLFVGFLLFSWNNPYQANVYDVRLALIPDGSFAAVYENWFTRVDLGPGRLLNVAVVVITLYALLTAFWRPVARAVGWFFIPLGGASLYVFILHVYFAILLSNLPPLQNGWIWLNTLAYTLVLAALWWMVRRQFLFRWVPR